MIHLEKIRTKIITKARLDKHERGYSVSLSSNNDVAKNAKEKDHRDFSIDGDLPRLYLLWSRVVFLEARAPFHPFATQYSGYYMNRDGRSSFSFFLALSRPVITKLAFSGRWRIVRGKRTRWKMSDVCPRGIVIFIGSQLSRGFSFSCPAVPCRRLLPLPREKPTAMKTLLFMRRKASPVVWMFRLFDMSVDRIARDDRRSDWIIRPFVEN